MRRNILIVLGGVVFACALIVGLFAFTGCGAYDLTTQERPEGSASLVLTVVEPMTSKMILPGGDIDFNYYIVKITHQVSLEEASQQVANVPPLEVTFPNIPSGDYDILVTGFNALDELIGSGIDVVSVLANDTSTQEVQVSYEAGDGDLQIDYTLVPDDLVFSPGIEVSLWDQTEWLPKTVVQDGPGAWSYDEVLPAGFYAQAFKLMSYGESNVHIAGGLEAVFIMSDRLTAGSYEFNEANVTPPTTGSTVVIIWEPLDMPFLTFFTDTVSQVDQLTEFTLEAGADIAVDLWYWFQNGAEIPGENESSLTLTSGDLDTIDNYSVLAKAGGALSSAQKLVETFDVEHGFNGLFTSSADQAGHNYYFINTLQGGGIYHLIGSTVEGQNAFFHPNVPDGDNSFRVIVDMDNSGMGLSTGDIYETWENRNISTYDIITFPVAAGTVFNFGTLDFIY